MLLDYKNKFQSSKQFSTISGDSKIKESVFNRWANVNMYRTSYNDMSNRVNLKI